MFPRIREREKSSRAPLRYPPAMPVQYGLIDPEDLPLPHLPEALEGLRIAHLTDLHTTVRTRRLDRLATQLTTLRLDLIFYTGDYMNRPGDEPVAAQVMRLLCDKVRPSLGAFGVYGNHDTPELREMLADLPIHWLNDDAFRLPRHPIEILGLNGLGYEEPDPIALALKMAELETPAGWAAVLNPRSAFAGVVVPPAGGAASVRPGGLARTTAPAAPPSPSAARASQARPARLMLAHYPSCITTAADMNVDTLFSGHTHGGQIRLPTGHALTNQSDLPLRLSSGILRHRDTLAAISRGIGETGFPRQRLFCPPQVPVYTLRRRSLPGRRLDTIELVRGW